MDDTQTLRNILEQTRVIAVVGLSANPQRPSHSVAQYLLANGYQIIPVNPAYNEVLGQKCYASLTDIPQPVDMVDCFRRSTEILPIAEAAIAIGAKTLWMQIGVVNEAAAEKARAAGLQVVMDRCIKIDHARLCRGVKHS
ncbi:MAG: CoA-binding protein [Burkholderiales bacterium]|nr:CoA-binding protein [Burkholderiales bacterium]